MRKNKTQTNKKWNSSSIKIIATYKKAYTCIDKKNLWILKWLVSLNTQIGNGILRFWQVASMVYVYI
jgi:hypothetical protein